MNILELLIFFEKVERDSLPAELRPENRALGRLRSYFNGLSPYPEENIERAEVAEHKDDENINDPQHIQVDIQPAKPAKEKHEEEENNDEGLVKAKPEAEEQSGVTDRELNTEEDSPSRKGSDLPNQSSDVFIKPIKAAQVQVGGGAKEVQDDKENNNIEV